ncbi:MAG: 50S ribosome-binding GTPase, partial [Desulfovibrio sp.]|nr:50S ribosome-binding GTPase [Desulfovibrio sp.]
MHGADEHSTIAAIATPPGRGGIAVLRLSGPDALAVLRRLFAPARSRAGGTPAQSGARDTTAPNEAVALSTRSSAGALSARDGADNLSEQGGAEAPAAVRCGAGFVFQPRRLHYGRVLDGRGEILDEALAVYMPGPASATGDDVGELHCHAGPGICAALLEAAVAAGAVPAGPGDFTRRAFLNGRLDLTQAEAVAELCDARTGAGARLAAAKLGGALGRETARLRVALDDLRLQCVLDADFPEEEAEHLGEAAFRQRIDDCASTLRRLLSAYERARFWREGASAVLVGRVNAGKSSLLNALLGRERAIVSEAPGTTRDYLEESLNLGGLEVRLADTAGLRAGGGTVESEGMRRAGALAEQADLVIFVKDVRDVVNPEASDVLDPARSGNAVVSEERTPPSRTGQIRARAGEDHPPRATDTERLSRQHSPCGVLESVSEGGERPPCPNNFGEATLYPEEKDFLRLHRERCRRGGLIAVLNKIDTLPGPEAVRRALKEFSAVLTDVIGEYPPDT